MQDWFKKPLRALDGVTPADAPTFKVVVMPITIDG
jgi:hypothetical protein